MLAAVLASLVFASAAGGQGGSALERYAPILRYDNSEEYFAQPVSLPPGTAEVRDGDVVYGHLAVEEGETWLQYWMFYAYNSQDRGIFKTGRHEGDWEMVQMRLGSDGIPDRVTLAQHSWAESCAYDELESTGGGSPVIYVANGSHASYATPGEHQRPFPDPDDQTGGDGRRVRPQMVEIRDDSPPWVAYDGPWGDSEAGWVPGEQSSPMGPQFQSSGAWERPATFDRDLGRECGSGAPGRWWQLPLVLVAIGLAAIAALVFLGRRRPPSRERRLAPDIRDSDAFR
jgi:hypothetical protein